MEKRLNIIGCGKVGMTLARLWTARQVLTLGQVLNRTLESGRQALAFIGAGGAVHRLDQMQAADIWLLAVPDDALADCCKDLAAAGLTGPDTIVFHCSGALSSQLLEPVARSGAACASIHPIRSFADPAQTAATFAGTFCGVEGDQRALTALETAFSAIGARFVTIDARFKTVYHAAAVFASNYLVTLLDVAMQAYVKAGVAPELALQLMQPLVTGTVENVFRMGPTDALTGPIARGDIATAVKQYRAVRDWDERHGELYKQLGKLSSDIARRR
jgi:predicted short-subunit dehydrogenase-like oxidoreductase (DUF2520 family)